MNPPPMHATDPSLLDLRWHWGSAYQIDHTGPDAWQAVRRDSTAALRADGPWTLLTMIRNDYLAHPVPRN